MINVVFAFLAKFILALSLLFIILHVLARAIAKLFPKKGYPKNFMLVFGSGGHTTELIMLFKDYDFNKLENIYFVRASSDITSEGRVYKYFEEKGIKVNPSKIKWIIIPRSRKVKQSYFSSIFTTIYSQIYTQAALFLIKPVDVLFCNGPGTCIPVVFSLIFINKVIGRNMRFKIVFFESFCRAYTLSLTGKIMYRIADKFIVHWESLKKKYPRAQYLGVII